MFIHPQELSQIQAYIAKTLKPNFINTLLRTLTLSKTPEKVLPIYNLMRLSPSHHDHFTFTFALKACAFLTSSLIQKGREVHASSLKAGHHSDIFVQNSLLAFYSAAFDIDACRTVFSEILSPDVVSWTSIVSAFTKNDCPGEALLAFTSMDVEPNEMTLVSALSACSRLKDGNLGKILHGFCLRRFGWHGDNVILDNALLDVYLDCGAFTDAVQLFDVMPHIDVVSGTTMICGCMHHGRYEEAIFMFVELVRDGEIVPNELTVACVLGACASTGNLKLGKWVHSYSLRNGIDVDGIVGNALIHMYSKCGTIGAALLIFGGLLYKDLVSWCTIIRGLATNGKPKHAMQLFALMLCCGVQPDNVAFLAVMSACCYAGLIQEGLMFFRAMHSIYGILPEKEHYTCIIDTYGRAACLKEAEDFFIGMPMQPDKCVWGALLSACKTHGADEVVYDRIQKRVVHTGMTLGGGTYALLSNLLAKTEKWDESNNVRKQLNAKKITKLVGCSWTEFA